MRRAVKIMMLGVMGKKATPTVYLLREEFAVDADAPLTSPRTCVPGPGTFTIKDTTSLASITGGKFTPSATSAAAGDPGIISSAVTRAAGVALISNFKRGPGLNASPNFGFHTSAANAAPAAGGLLTDSTTATIFPESLAAFLPWVSANAYDVGIIMRSAGCFLVLNNRLKWVSDRGSDANLYFVCGASAARPAGILDFVHVLQLNAPWNTDDGIATTALAGARSAGDLFTHEGNVFLKFTVTTLPSSGQIEVRFRIQDADNYWQVTVDSTGLLDLDEVVAGTPTERGTAAGVIANGDIVRVAADGISIKIVEGAASTTTLRISYATANNFVSATGGKLEALGTGGAVTNIVAYPIDLSGTAYSELIRGGVAVPLLNTVISSLLYSSTIGT